MNIKEQLKSDLLMAMRNSDAVKKDVIRMALASIKLVEIEKHAEADDSTVLGILQKEIKQRLETIEDAKKISRTDLVEQNDREILVLKEYLPKQLSEEELNRVVNDVILETGATGMKEMGQVMRLVIQKVAGHASNEMISASIRKSLSRE